MSWTKLDDQFFTHPKVIDLPKDAKLLYLAALTYCAAQLTDGAITSGALRVIAATVDVSKAEADALVSAGLWEKSAEGWMVHDWLKCGVIPDPTTQDLRKTRQYQDWRIKVLKSDSYACRMCGASACMLHAHHILPFAAFADGRFDVTNGVTLCVPCHEIVHGRKLQ